MRNYNTTTTSTSSCIELRGSTPVEGNLTSRGSTLENVDDHHWSNRTLPCSLPFQTWACSTPQTISPPAPPHTTAEAVITLAVPLLPAAAAHSSDPPHLLTIPTTRAPHPMAPPSSDPPHAGFSAEEEEVEVLITNDDPATVTLRTCSTDYSV